MASVQNSTLYSGIEWSRWVSWVETLARTGPGRDQVSRLRSAEGFASDFQDARRRQAETEDAFWLTTEHGLWGALRELPHFDESLKSLEKGRVLSVPEIACLRRWIRASETWRTWVFPEARSQSGLVRSAQSLSDLSFVLGRLERLLDVSDQLSDNASDELSRLLSKKRASEAEVRERMRRLVSDLGEQGVLQEKYVDQRAGAFVLPVRAQDQGRVDGRIVDASASKQTVFIEPEVVRQISRSLSEIELKIDEEIYRIRVEISDVLRPLQGVMRFAFETLADWDAIGARAFAAERLNAVPIEVMRNRKWTLKGAVHPLLALEESKDFVLVRNDFVWDEVPILLISGPNTGGKTVWMKTLGFFALFARTGFFATAEGQCEVPFFDELLIDVGDSQNLEEHLSSFSGHLKRMKEALEHPSHNKLVLLDELNSATDPDEGAALAQALLEALSERSTIVATTHDPRLKAFGVKDERVLNASVAFDEVAGRPEYRLVVGQAGSSRAFETARRLGIPEMILQRAGDLISKRTLEMNDVLAQLEAERKTLLQREAEVQAREQSTSERELNLKNRFQKQLESEQKNALAEIQVRAREFQERFKDLLKRMTEVRSHDALRKIREDADQLVEQSRATFVVPKESAPDLESDDSIQVDDSVYVRSMRQIGVVQSFKGAKAKVQLDRGMLVEVKTSDLERSNRVQRRSTYSGRVHFEAADSDSLRTTLDLRGERVESGLARLDAYLNQAKISGLVSCKVIHGTGTGALKEAVRKYLAEQAWIQRYEEAPLTDGGAGVTWIYL